MNTTDKVMSWLEGLAEPDWRECYSDSEVQETARQALDLIDELLKEQEAVKPYIDIDEAKCPICKVKLTRQELLGDNVLYEDFFDYCPHCGRKVEWE